MSLSKLPQQTLLRAFTTPVHTTHRDIIFPYHNNIGSTTALPFNSKSFSSSLFPAHLFPLPIIRKSFTTKNFITETLTEKEIKELIKHRKQLYKNQLANSIWMQRLVENGILTVYSETDTSLSQFLAFFIFTKAILLTNDNDRMQNFVEKTGQIILDKDENGNDIDLTQASPIFYNTIADLLTLHEKLVQGDITDILTQCLEEAPSEYFLKTILLNLGLGKYIKNLNQIIRIQKEEEQQELLNQESKQPLENNLTFNISLHATALYCKQQLSPTKNFVVEITNDTQTSRILYPYHSANISATINNLNTAAQFLTDAKNHILLANENSALEITISNLHASIQKLAKENNKTEKEVEALILRTFFRNFLLFEYVMNKALIGENLAQDIYTSVDRDTLISKIIPNNFSTIQELFYNKNYMDGRFCTFEYIEKESTIKALFATWPINKAKNVIALTNLLYRLMVSSIDQLSKNPQEEALLFLPKFLFYGLICEEEYNQESRLLSIRQESIYCKNLLEKYKQGLLKNKAPYDTAIAMLATTINGYEKIFSDQTNLLHLLTDPSVELTESLTKCTLTELQAMHSYAKLYSNLPSLLASKKNTALETLEILKAVIRNTNIAYETFEENPLDSHVANGLISTTLSDPITRHYYDVIATLYLFNKNGPYLDDDFTTITDLQNMQRIVKDYLANRGEKAINRKTMENNLSAVEKTINGKQQQPRSTRKSTTLPPQIELI